MEINKINYIEQHSTLRPPYWQSAEMLKAILTDPKFWQYIGNSSIQSIQLAENQYDKNSITVTTDDGRTITINVKPIWHDQWMDTCDFEIEYVGEPIREDEVSVPDVVHQLIQQLHEDSKGYAILQVFRENDSWKVITLI